jgi:membrane protease subunit HflC
MKALTTAFLGLLALVVLVVMSGAAYTVTETEQVIITQFGRPVGEPGTEPGLHVKLPFIQQVNRMERRILEWDGRTNEMPTKDKLYILVDTFGRWRISDPLQYFLRLRDERSALSRLDDILGSETRNAVAKHDLIEIIRTTKDRVPLRDESLAEVAEAVGVLHPIMKGRSLIEQQIYANAAPKLADFGIELLDVRFKRINYNSEVQQKIFERMISERQQIASRFRSEGEGEAARILGNKDREEKRIRSEAYRTIEEIRGKADARATDVYARSYDRSPEAIAFYEFIKTMETYRTALGADTTVVLSTDSDLLKFLKRSSAEPRR